MVFDGVGIIRVSVVEGVALGDSITRAVAVGVVGVELQALATTTRLKTWANSETNRCQALAII